MIFLYTSDLNKQVSLEKANENSLDIFRLLEDPEYFDEMLLYSLFLAELFRGMLFKWKGENKKSHQK